MSAIMYGRLLIEENVVTQERKIAAVVRDEKEAGYWLAEYAPQATRASDGWNDLETGDIWFVA